MPALTRPTRNPRRAHYALLVLSLVSSLLVAACSDDATPTASQDSPSSPQTQAQTQAQPLPRGTLIQTPAQTFNAGASSPTDSVVLAPPVIHTVD